MTRKLAAEFFGTFWLVFGGCGSAVLAAGFPHLGIAFAGVALAFGLTVLTMAYAVGGISGGHFNPAVSLVFMLRRELPIALGTAYIAVQIASGIAGVFATHLMFERPVFEIATKLRDGPAQAFSEFVATFGLVTTILGALRFCPERVAALVGLYIASAYWFTASTSFANPAVTISRALSDSFAGIAPNSAPAFIAAQLAAAVIAYFASGWLFGRDARTAEAEPV